VCRNLKEQLLVDLGFEIPWRTPAFFSSVKGDISDHEAKKEAKKKKADATAFGCARPAPPRPAPLYHFSSIGSSSSSSSSSTAMIEA
jgi:hypothetical protein